MNKDAIWKSGLDAFHAGESEFENPYSPGDPAHEIWLDGWEDGYEDAME